MINKHALVNLNMKYEEVFNIGYNKHIKKNIASGQTSLIFSVSHVSSTLSVHMTFFYNVPSVPYCQKSGTCFWNSHSCYMSQNVRLIYLRCFSVNCLLLSFLMFQLVFEIKF